MQTNENIMKITYTLHKNKKKKTKEQNETSIFLMASYEKF